MRKVEAVKQKRKFQRSQTGHNTEYPKCFTISLFNRLIAQTDIDPKDSLKMM